MVIVLGASIYFSTPYEEKEKYLREISQFGINYVFTSMQIPEEKSVRVVKEVYFTNESVRDEAYGRYFARDV